MVYHYPGCSYVGQMKESNKATFSSSAEARAAGYHPCSRCKPP
ncbi:MAG: Ada metal-binding domain-containing protein [Halobacteriota archaeon]